jgi:hypothetical protein
MCAKRASESSERRRRKFAQKLIFPAAKLETSAIASHTATLFVDVPVPQFTTKQIYVAVSQTYPIEAYGANVEFNRTFIGRAILRLGSKFGPMLRFLHHLLVLSQRQRVHVYVSPFSTSILYMAEALTRPEHWTTSHIRPPNVCSFSIQHR